MGYGIVSNESVRLNAVTRFISVEFKSHAMVFEGYRITVVWDFFIFDLSRSFNKAY